MTALYPPLPTFAQTGGQPAPIAAWGARTARIMQHVLRTAAAVEASDRPTTNLIAGFCVGLESLRFLFDGEVSPAWVGSYRVPRCISPPGGRYSAEIRCTGEIAGYLIEAGGSVAGTEVQAEHRYESARRALRKASQRVETLAAFYLPGGDSPIPGAGHVLTPGWRWQLDVCQRDAWDDADAA